MTGLSLRKAVEADLPALLALYGQPSFNNGRVISLDEARTIFARFASYPDYAIHLAECDGRVVGTFALMVIDNIAHWGTPTALVENVVVAEGEQGGGIGRWMMRRAFEIAAGKGAYKVALSSNIRSENAHRFYESLGFEKYGYSFRLEPVPAESEAPTPSLPRKGGGGAAPAAIEATPSSGTLDVDTAPALEPSPLAGEGRVGAVPFERRARSVAEQ